MSYPPSRITVELPHVDGFDLTNADRAAMVDPLLRAFGEAYYPGDFRPDEPLIYYIVSDFLCDLMHWCDQVPVTDDDAVDLVDFMGHVEAARLNYVEEVAEEQEGGDEASV